MAQIRETSLVVPQAVQLSHLPPWSNPQLYCRLKQAGLSAPHALLLFVAALTPAREAGIVGLRRAQTEGHNQKYGGSGAVGIHSPKPFKFQVKAVSLVSSRTLAVAREKTKRLWIWMTNLGNLSIEISIC